MVQSTQLNEDHIPSEFICPITCEIMRDPLMCRTGQSFERSAILQWLEKHNNTCPLTRKILRVSDLIPNRSLQARIEAYQHQHGVVPKQAPADNNFLLTCLISECSSTVDSSAVLKKSVAPLDRSSLNTQRQQRIRSLISSVQSRRRVAVVSGHR